MRHSKMYRHWIGWAAPALLASACATVPPGYTGVLFTTSGLQKRPLGEGVSLISPLSSVRLYDLRLQTRTEDLAATAADGAPLIARASVVAFHVAPEEVVALHHEVGPHYYSRVVRPLVRSEVRRVLAGFRSEELDTTAGIRRAQARIEARLAPALRPFHLISDSVDIRTLVVDYSQHSYGVILKTGVLEQRALSTPQILAIARHRADVRRQEARAIAAQHALVRRGLTPQTLTHAAIRALDKLVTAPSTTVITGTGATLMEVP